jgi:hypothetical protein
VIVKRSLLGLVLGIGLSALPSVVQAEELVPLLNESIAGKGWAAYAIDSNGSDLNVTATMAGGTFPGHVGAYVYDPTGRLIIGLTMTTLSGNTGAYVDAHPAPGGDVHVDERDPKMAGGASAASVGTTGQNPRSAGIVYAVVWGAGDLQGFDVEIKGGPDAKLVEDANEEPLVERGPEAYLLTTEDFSGAAHVEAGPSVSQIGFRHPVRATLLTEAQIEVKNTFVGTYGVGFASPVPGAPAGSPMQLNSMSVDEPDRTRDCPCHWTSFVPDDLGPPGKAGVYTFRNTGAGIFGGAGDIYVGGADVRLPAVP